MSFIRLKDKVSDHNSKSAATDRVNEISDQPPTYEDSLKQESSWSESGFNPANWTKSNWGVAIFLIGAAIGGAIAIGVIVTKNNSYPNYTALSYSLADTYSGSSFFDNFDYWSAADPADGFVIYVDEPGAVWLNLTYATDSSAVLKVDTTTNVDTSSGRRSVRISSKNTYNSGLFVFDVLHTPYGCATWPALWLSDPYNWPAYGEIDVIESVNTGATGNQMTLHTSDGCKMNVKREETGTVDNTNCWNGTNSNAGCGVKGSAATYGEEFNNNGGGVYAMEWRSAGIRVWFWNRDSIPSDIDTSTSNTSTTSTTPDPSSWGTPLADFPSTHCDIDTHFKNQSIIANIDLCGSWAGSTDYYSTIASCPGTCDSYVQNNGSAFSEAYWEFASFRVYTAS